MLTPGTSRCSRSTVAGLIAVALVVVVPAVVSAAPAAEARERGERNVGGIDPRAVQDTIRRIADWQLAHPVDRDPRHWSMAPLHDGLIDASLATGDPRYLAAVLRSGMRVDFRMGSRIHYAGGHAAVHAWLRIYAMDPRGRPRWLTRLVRQFDEAVANPVLEPLSFARKPPRGRRTTDRWSWADALYLSPPTFALLARITGDDRILRWMRDEYQFARDALYDEKAHLFYRDATYFDARSPRGQKVFWSRGNAWVYAGLALTLDAIPPEHPTRRFYVDLMKDMSPAVLAAQQPDGWWRQNLADPDQVPYGETSGTALFAVGMAWGIRNGVLDAKTCWPAVERAWAAILGRVESDGAVTGVQPFGEAPVEFDLDSRSPIGTGAVLQAGYQILLAEGAAPDLDRAKLLARARSLVSEVPDLSTVCKKCVEPTRNAGRRQK